MSAFSIIVIICSGPPLAPSRLLCSCRARRPARPRRTSSGRTRSPKDPGPTPSADRSRLRSGPPGPWTTTRRRTLRVTPASEPHPPLHTHRGAPSCVPDADARPTLTAAAAAAEAEGWISPTPSPTAQGRPAKPPAKQL